MKNSIKIIFLAILIFNLVYAEETQSLDMASGTWCGKWDDLYATCFTIKKENFGYKALYTWEEQIGRNRQEKTLRGFQVNDNTINFENKIVTFDLIDPSKATALGIFEQHSRVANLVKQPAID